jgi:hypothetical protein
MKALSINPKWTWINPGRNAGLGPKVFGQNADAKVGRADYRWIYRNKNVRAPSALDVRYRNTIVELDKSLPPEVMVLNAGGENCTLVLTV